MRKKIEEKNERENYSSPWPASEQKWEAWARAKRGMTYAAQYDTIYSVYRNKKYTVLLYCFFHISTRRWGRGTRKTFYILILNTLIIFSIYIQIKVFIYTKYIYIYNLYPSPPPLPRKLRLIVVAMAVVVLLLLLPVTVDTG